jgi:hypothetical protein
MEDRVDGFRLGSSSSAVLSRISLGLSGLSISGSPLMGLFLNPSISLSVCFKQKEKGRRTRKSDQTEGKMRRKKKE